MSLFDYELIHNSKNHIREIKFDTKIEASVAVIGYFNMVSKNGLESGNEESIERFSRAILWRKC